MSVSIDESVAMRSQELENLKAFQKDYPDAWHDKGRLYRVSQFRPEDEPNTYVMDGDVCQPCIKYGDGDTAIFVVDGMVAMKPETLLYRLFKSHPDLVMKVLKW